jgi:hypothetical protein
MTNANPTTFPPKPIGHNFRDLEGQTFGQLTVLRFAGCNKHGNALWEVRCSCDRIVICASGHMITGHTMSCGCHKRSQITEGLRLDHGESRLGTLTPEYRAYRNAKARCEHPNNHAYPNYGGRGIQFKFTSIREFLAEVGRKPSAKHSLDRIDVNGHYEKGNVRWATDLQQARNQRSNRRLTFHNETKCLTEWAEVIGVDSKILSNRLNVYKWSVEKTLTTPNRKTSR